MQQGQMALQIKAAELQLKKEKNQLDQLELQLKAEQHTWMVSWML